VPLLKLLDSKNESLQHNAALLMIFLIEVWNFTTWICWTVFIGEWMNSSAGQAFGPHVITIEAGEVCSISFTNA
jgi:hypothetical protein